MATRCPLEQAAIIIANDNLPNGRFGGEASHLDHTAVDSKILNRPECFNILLQTTIEGTGRVLMRLGAVKLTRVSLG